MQSLTRLFPDAAAVEGEIQEQLDFHLAMLERDAAVMGLAEDEARRWALSRFGDPATIVRTCLREKLGGRIMFAKTTVGLLVVCALLLAGLALLQWNTHRQDQARLESMYGSLASLTDQVDRLTAMTDQSRWIPPEIDAGLVRSVRNDGCFDELVQRGPVLIPELSRILLHQELDSVTRFMAANILGEIGSREALEPLLQGLTANHFNVRRCSALALAQIGDPRAIPHLERVAANDPYVYTDRRTGDREHLVRIDARKALARLGK